MLGHVSTTIYSLILPTALAVKSNGISSASSFRSVMCFVVTRLDHFKVLKSALLGTGWYLHTGVGVAAYVFGEEYFAL